MIPRNLQISMVVLFIAVLLLAVYMRNMRGRVSQSPAAGDARPIAPPAAGPSEQAALYVAYDSPGILHAQPARIPLPSGRQQRAQELLQALLQIYLGKNSPHALPPGADIRDVYIVDPGLAVIDLNGAFADGHRSGVLVEELSVASLVQTLGANIPGLNRVKILVDGKERDTLAGHADLSRYYETAVVAKLAEQLASAQ
ncbi:MAG TPA: GerMN domain-containing protein [Terriglobales bacterium]|nr:GerMN domain-containing protein [Terriglobales bacterium]